MKTKIKSHGDEFTKLQSYKFYKIPSVGSNHTCLAVISLDSTLKKDDNCYPQVFLKECKYIELKVIRHITQDIEIFPRIVFFFNEHLKKFQKHDKAFLCKLFLYLDYAYTLGYKKVLFTILITRYTAYKSIFALLLLPFVDYKNVLPKTLSISYMAD